MKVVIEVSNDELKKYLHHRSESNYFPENPDYLGVLVFHEYCYEHDPDCSEDHAKLNKEGRLCHGRDICKPNNSSTAFRVLQINP